MWQLKLAPQKCSVCRFQNLKWQIPGNYSFSNIQDRRLYSSCFRYHTWSWRHSRLQVKIWQTYFCHSSQSPCYRANLILRCFSSRDRTLLVKPFCTNVCPLLEYSTPVWTQYRYLIDTLEKVQRRFTKRLSGLRHMSYPGLVSKYSVLNPCSADG